MHKIKTKTILQKFARFIKLKVIHADDSAHRIAFGLAIGVFIAWSPALGFHLLLALLLAFLLRANKALAVIGTFVHNPFTFFPIYYSGYIVGNKTLILFNLHLPETNFDMQATFAKFDLISNFSRIHTLDFWKELIAVVWEIGLELWVGCTILGIISALVTYFVFYYIITNRRKANPRRRFLKYFHKPKTPQ